MSIKRFVFAAAMFVCAAGFAEVAVKNNDKIAFLGDSITYYGNNQPGGYVNLVMAGLSANGIKAHKLPAGISGHKSNQMLERLDRDVINHKANFLFVSCGVNDVWHGVRGVKLEDYKKNMTAIVDKAQKAGIKVCIMTATMIKEDPENELNKTLAPYNAFLRQLAAEKKCLLADTNADMQQALKELRKKYPDARGNLLTSDGVHMAPAGDMLMARCLLKAVGIAEGSIDFKKLDAKAELLLHVPLSFYEELYHNALQKGQGAKNVGSCVNLSVKK